MLGGMSQFDRPTVELALRRSRGCCERCGRHVASARRGRDWSAHHRLPAGMGGSRDPLRYSVANCLVLCGTGTEKCHGWVESHREESYELGLLVRMADDPSEVPVTLRNGARVLLTLDGEYASIGRAPLVLDAEPGMLLVQW